MRRLPGRLDFLRLILHTLLRRLGLLGLLIRLILHTLLRRLGLLGLLLRLILHTLLPILGKAFFTLRFPLFLHGRSIRNLRLPFTPDLLEGIVGQPRGLRGLGQYYGPFLFLIFILHRNTLFM